MYDYRRLSQTGYLRGEGGTKKRKTEYKNGHDLLELALRYRQSEIPRGVLDEMEYIGFLGRNSGNKLHYRVAHHFALLAS